MISSDQNFHPSDRSSQETGQAFPEPSQDISHQVTQKRLHIRIPKTLHQEPIISRLISDYNLTVNIKAAILGANANGDGWFDLSLQGSVEHLVSAMTYLNRMEVEIWKESKTEEW